MRQLAVLVVLAALTPGCVATIDASGDKERVATFHLQADQLDALLIDECVAQHGPEGCVPQQNDLGCKTMTVEVQADGRTLIDCRDADGRVKYEGYADIGSGSPFICTANEDQSCQVCKDLNGTTIFDNCNRSAQAFRLIGTNGWTDLPAGSAYIEENGGSSTSPTDTGSTTTSDTGSTTTSAEACDSASAVKAFAAELNKLLAAEGLNVTWMPTDIEIPSNPLRGFFGASNVSCEAFTNPSANQGRLGLLQQCVSQGPNGECSFCQEIGGVKTCRCQRINVAAIKTACAAIPPSCDKAAWSAALIMAYGRSNTWLFSSSYNRPLWSQQLLPVQTLQQQQQQQQQFPRCLGSPLVLDLAGDGIAPTSPAQGVDFDLFGRGALRTAWVQNDDALLALDRNGNGQIDSGAELFGEATASRPWDSGFAALASLDENRDGIVDARDARYRQLVLWQDLDGDGRSRPAELRSLAAAGVRSLELKPTRTSAVDAYGTDLSLQSSFTRQDGSQSALVDVFFAIARPR